MSARAAVTFGSLRGGLDAEHTDEVAAPDVQRHAHQIRHIPFAVFAQQPDEEIVDGGHDRLKDSLTLGDVFDPQIPASAGIGTEDRNAMMPQLTTTDSGMESPKTETISTFSSSFLKAAVNAFILFCISPFSFCGMYHSTIVPKFVAARPRFYLLLYSISRSAEKCCTLRTNT